MAKDPNKPATRTARVTRSRQQLLRRDRKRADALIDQAFREAIREQGINGDVSPFWKQESKELISLLKSRPLLDDATYRSEFNDGSSQKVTLRVEDEQKAIQTVEIERSLLVNIKEQRQL